MLHLLGKNVFEVNLLHILAETFLIFLDYKYMLLLLFHNSTDNERSDSCIYFFLWGIQQTISKYFSVHYFIVFNIIFV